MVSLLARPRLVFYGFCEGTLLSALGLLFGFEFLLRYRLDLSSIVRR